MLLSGALLAGLCLPWSQGPAQAPRTTLTGVYTSEQAARGKDMYSGLCASCHTAIAHAGPVFTNHWRGRLLSELFGYITETMPKGDPGSLTPQETTLILAYMLRLNGFPAGNTELPADQATLRRIRFEVAAPHSPRNDTRNR